MKIKKNTVRKKMVTGRLTNESRVPSLSYLHVQHFM